MRLALLAVLAAFGLSRAAAPSPGDVMHLVRVDAYDVVDGGYLTFLARGFFYSDGGLDALPTLPPDYYVLRVMDGGVICASALLCAQYDGGVDNTQAATPDCGCTTGTACTLSDGGAAPNGMTLSPGTFSGAGCTPKSCVALFLPLPDGGLDGTWPQTCPLQ